MAEASLKLGGDWATKEGSLLGFNDQNGNYKPIPFDFTRATTATRVNRDGLIEEVQSGVPRIDFLDNPDGALLLEPQRTNLIDYSSDLSVWTGGAVYSANTDISPSGYQDADTLNDNTTAYLDKRKNASISINTTHTFSLFVKKTTGSLTHYAGFAVLLTGGTTRVDYGIINTTTGVINRDASSNINSVSYSSESYGEYWRVIMTFTDNQSNTLCTAIVYPAISSNGTSISQLAQGSNVFWGAQLEEGSYATSYIPTYGSAVTAAKDTASDSNVTPTSNKATLYIEISGDDDSTNRNVCGFRNGTTNQYGLYFWGNDANKFGFNTWSGDSYGITNSTIFDGSVHKIAAVFDFTDFTQNTLFIDGVKQSISQVRGTTVQRTANKVSLISPSSAEDPRQNVHQFLCFNSALSDEEAISLTTI